jgi:2-amino-4-hydroxy-6-hydroxymethyldihydropteridine diphosphokinase
VTGPKAEAGIVRLAYLGLGSNVGDRRANLQAAVEALWGHHVETLASSSVYETDPVGGVEQADFLNACIRAETALEPHALLHACKAVERALGREVDGPGYVRWGPRPIDVDVLLLEDQIVDAPDLRIPHPELANRRFVLVPLLELDPDVVVPGRGPAADALAALGDGDGVRRAGPPLDLSS